MKIVNYEILSAPVVGKLCNLVEDYLLTGWQPLGQPYCDFDREEFWHYQAMVKYEEQSQIPE